jgi:hypothetical protein
MSSGFFAQMFGQTPDPTFTARPQRALGPRYKVVYVVPGGNDIQSRVVQWIYPYAKPVALTHMRANQLFWQTERTHGAGTGRTASLKKMLVRAGLSRTAP